MKKELIPAGIKINCIMVWIVSFLVFLALGWYINEQAEKEEKLKAYYTAELTASRVDAQLRKYLEVSDLLRNTVESGHDISGEEYAAWAQCVPNNSRVIKAIELAKDGIVSEIYPLEGNSDAMGINMLTNPARMFEANMAMLSGQYTLAGPYPLAQGGMGALLFNPIYVRDPVKDQTVFWGFAILVVDWDRFIDEIGMHKLSDASFVYELKKGEESYSYYTTIAKSDGELPEDTVKVASAVPNDVWYLELAPKNGWVTRAQKILTFVLAIIAACSVMVIFYQFEMKRYKEKLYAEKIQHSADEARRANEAKTRFLFNMSHDIRTPMNAIIGFAHLLGLNLGDETKCRDYLAKIQNSSKLLLTIINQVLEMSRIESGKAVLNPAPMSIRESIASLNTVFEPEVAKQQLKYNCKLKLEQDCVLCDKTKFEEIILNIVSNAIKYTEPGGRVCLEVMQQEMTSDGRVVYEIIVEDTGIGMQPDYLPHIFEEFSREHTTTETKVAGTGLGLPIVKSLIELMGGTIAVESKVGVGTKFTIKLAFAPAGAESEADIQQEEFTVPVSGKRILLAEDNALNAEIAEAILKNAGFSVTHAEDGIKCIEELVKMPPDYYDVILMDVQMPHMDGYTATQEIRKLTGARAQIPIIAMTANVYEEDKQRAYASGMTGFLAKPLNIKEMLKVLGEQVRK